MAAFRAGIKTVVIPEANVPDLEEIVPAVREDFILYRQKQWTRFCPLRLCRKRNID